MSRPVSSDPLLVFEVGSQPCGVPRHCVIETMRPLPIEALGDAPPFVAGVSIVRGAPTVIVDLGALLDDQPLEAPGRLVTLRVPDSERVVGVLVDRVLGLYQPPDTSPIPPLLKEAGGGHVEQLAQLDGGLLRVLDAGRCVTPEVWDQLARMGGVE